MGNFCNVTAFILNLLIRKFVSFVKRLKKHLPKYFKYAFTFEHLNTYIITKTICPPGYHRNGFVATHATGHTTYGYTLLVPGIQRMLNNPRKERNILNF